MHRAVEPAHFTEAIDLYHRCVEALADDDINRCRCMSNLAHAYERLHELTGREADLRSAVEWGRRAVDAAPADQPEWAGVLGNLVSAHLRLYLSTENLADLDAAIECGERARAATPAGDPRAHRRLGNLNLAYQWRFNRTGDPHDLDAMLECGELSLAAAEPDASEAGIASWMRLVGGYSHRFELTGDPADLDAGIARGKRAVQVIPAKHQDRRTVLYFLASAHHRRFARSQATEDLTALFGYADAAAAGPAGHPDQQMAAALLAEAHNLSFDRFGRLADLDTAIRLREGLAAELPANDPGLGPLLANLGLGYLQRFRHTGAPENIDTARARTQRALAVLPRDHPDHARCQSVLGMVYSARYELTAAAADLAASIDHEEAALAALPDGHPGQVTARANLAVGLQLRFQLTMNMADLAASIEYGEQALAGLPPGDPNRSACLANVGVGYRRRFEYNGDARDLDTAVRYARDALAALPPDHPQRGSRLVSLANAYSTRFDQTATPADLDAAIDCGRLAVDGTAAGTTDWSHAVSNVAGYLLSRFQSAGERGDLNDISASIEFSERGLATLPADHPRRRRLTSILAGAHLLRYRRSGLLADLDAAVAYGQRVVAETGPDEPAVIDIGNLAVAYRTLHSAGGRVPDGAVAGLAAAVQGPATASPVEQASAQYNVGLLAKETGAATVAGQVLRAAVQTLPLCAPRNLNWADQESRLGGSVGLVGEAVAAQLELNDVAGALELAELGRGIILTGQLDLRTTLTELKRAAPDLAEEFARLRDALNATPGAAGDRGDPAAVAHRRELADRWQPLVERIRQVAGFGSFLAAPGLADLRRAAAGGTVVLVNSASSRSDAILIGPESVDHIRLDTLTQSEARAQAAAIVELAEGPDAVPPPSRRSVLPEVLAWLWETIAEPVLDALGHTSPGDGSALPRVWWVPTGMLGLLPVHVAGVPHGPSALDRVVSSYAPTIRTLLRGGSRPATDRVQLTVAMPHTPGQPDLPGTVAEAAALHATHPEAIRLTNVEATAAAVRGALEQATWAHFACHAANDLAAPSRSGLLLHDSVLTLPDISRLQLDHPELCYLSACSTGRSGWVHPDEALHLGSAFQLAGYRHVIATLWPLDDAIGAIAARRFYQLLPSSPTADGSAVALHRLTRELRDRYPDRLDYWAPFVHSGP